MTRRTKVWPLPLSIFVTHLKADGIHPIFNYVFRTFAAQAGIHNGFQNTIGASPHTAGVAFDLRVVGMTASEISTVRAAATANGLTQLKSRSEPWHLQAEDLITRGADGRGDAAFRAKITENQQSAAMWEVFRAVYPQAFGAMAIDLTTPSSAQPPLRIFYYSPGLGALDPAAFGGGLIDSVWVSGGTIGKPAP